MGADLYIKSVYQRRGDYLHPLFTAACAERDTIQKAHPGHSIYNENTGDIIYVADDGSDEPLKAQKRVEELYREMSLYGYYRESYSSTNALSCLNLSWWGDILPIVERGNGYMSLEETRWFFDTVNESFPLLEKRVAALPEGEQRYLRNQYDRLLSFLALTLALKEKPYMSL